MPLASQPRLSINKTAIVENWCSFCQLAPKSDIAAVVKSDAYGLGAPEISKALYQAGCRLFFCATVPECLSVLAALPQDDQDLQVISLGGFFSKEIPYYQNDHRLTPVLNTLEQLRVWRDNSSLHNRDTFIHIDTGMNRLGIHYAHWSELRGLLDFPIYALISHLATAENNTAFAKTQLQRFLACEGFPRSLVNTAGAFLGTEFHGALLRPGIGLYGSKPLRSVVELDSPILQIRDVAPNDTIGYDQAYRAVSAMRIATVGIGYNDGLPRNLSNHETFSGWWQGHKLPIRGRISMDSLALDITDHPTITETSRLSFLNAQQGIDDLAKACNTIPHEALTRLGGRIHKVYTE